MTTNQSFIPTQEWIDNLQVGDMAPDCFSGKMREVKEITYYGTDIEGNDYVGVKLEFGEDSTITESYKVGRKHLTMADQGKRKRDQRQIEEREKEIV